MVKVEGQKADDWEVPIELWDKIFVLAWATDFPGGTLPRDWRQALCSLRKGFAVWWKRQVLWSWIEHLKHPQHAGRDRRVNQPLPEMAARWC